MDNNLSDINYTLQTIVKSSTTNENDKVIKIVQTQPQTHTLNAYNSGSAAGFILCPTKALAFGSFSKFLLQIVLTLSIASSTDFTVRLWCINSNYDEEIIDIVYTAGLTTYTTANQYRCVNNMEIVAGAITIGGVSTLSATPSGLSTNYEICRLNSNNTEKYNCLFMCPRGKRAKLSSLDYLICRSSTANISTDFGLQIFLRDGAVNMSNTLFNYLQIPTPFNKTYNVNSVYNIEYGDLVIFYRQTNTSGAVLTAITATFTLYDDGVY